MATSKLLDMKKTLKTLPSFEFRSVPHSVTRRVVVDTKFEPLLPVTPRSLSVLSVFM